MRRKLPQLHLSPTRLQELVEEPLDFNCIAIGIPDKKVIDIELLVYPGLMVWPVSYTHLDVYKRQQHRRVIWPH